MECGPPRRERRLGANCPPAAATIKGERADLIRLGCGDTVGCAVFRTLPKLAENDDIFNDDIAVGTPLVDAGERGWVRGLSGW